MCGGVGGGGGDVGGGMHGRHKPHNTAGCRWVGSQGPPSPHRTRVALPACSPFSPSPPGQHQLSPPLTHCAALRLFHEEEGDLQGGREGGLASGTPLPLPAGPLYVTSGAHLRV